MTGQVQPRRRGAYGIDAPYWAAFLAVLIVIQLVAALVSGSLLSFLPVMLLLAIFGSALYTTLRGKFVVWAGLLDKLELRGEERILDLGCGRGAVLLLAAQHLTTGRAVGVDLWRTGDQSGNSADGPYPSAFT